MTALGIDLGPPSGADVVFGLDPRNSKRLLVRHRSGGCIRVLGIFFLGGGLALQAVGLLDGISWGALAGGLAMGLFGAFLLFARSSTAFDRHIDQIEHGFTVGVTTVFHRQSLVGFDRVMITEKVDVSHDEDGDASYSTTFKVELWGSGNSLTVASTGLWETSVPVAEAMSRFLRLPLHDRAAKRVRQPDELDLSLREQRRRGSFGSSSGKPSGENRSTIVADDTRRLAVSIPRPDGRPMLAVLVFVLVLWTLPVGLLSRSFFIAFLPAAVVLASWLKVAFGFSSEIEATPELLRVQSRGLVMRRTVEIPTDELENLALRQFEWGGPRSTLAHMLDGFLIARSDRSAVRFGHGLATAELAWLRSRLLDIVTAPMSASNSRPTTARRQLPVLASKRFFLVIGAALGIVLAHLVGGPLGICVAIPFLEHVVSVGAILGFVTAVVLFRSGEEQGVSKPLLWTVSTLAVLAVALLLPNPEWVQSSPSFKEARLLTTGPRPATFWLGWMIVGACANALLAALALPIVSRVVRVVRRPREQGARGPAENSITAANRE